MSNHRDKRSPPRRKRALARGPSGPGESPLQRLEPRLLFSADLPFLAGPGVADESSAAHVSALAAPVTALVDQVQAHRDAKAEMGAAGQHLTLSLSRLAHLARDTAERERKLDAAEFYYSKFDNVFAGPGQVTAGMIDPLPRNQTREELADSLLIYTPQEMIDKLGIYADLGIDRVILNPNFGLPQSETQEMIARFAEEVMPHFALETA